ncbi:MAG TPA: GNAT family N-acetyltransferase [Pilimelia sp.]|nr:GNAT family N-acetyltransferase [Pilimelia sp.]
MTRNPPPAGTPAPPPTAVHPSAAGPTAPGPAPAPAAVHVRRVRAQDTARMRALRLEMLADAPLAFLEWLDEAAARPHEEFRARLLATVAGDERAQFVAVTPTGELVGHAGGTAWPELPDVTVLYAVYVTPAHRGTGLLGALVDAVAAWSRAVGRHTLHLEVVNGNDRALRAYLKLGFVETGEIVPHPRIPVLTERRLRRPA